MKILSLNKMFEHYDSYVNSNHFVKGLVAQKSKQFDLIWEGIRIQSEHWQWHSTCNPSLFIVLSSKTNRFLHL
jgi:hypothetical protein